MAYIVTEVDSDDDIVNVTGPFMSQFDAGAWMRGRVEKFACKWQDDLDELNGVKPNKHGLIVKTEFHPSGCYVHADCDPQSFNIVALQEPK